MTDSFGIGDGNFEDSALVASRWTSGGNSAAARRARVKLQRRDKYGRWAEMGGGVSFPGKMADGSTKTVIGRYIGPAKRDGYMRVQVTDPNAGVPRGVYEVNGKVATVSKAILSGEQLEEAGVKLDVNGKRIGENLDKDIEPFGVMLQNSPPDDVEAHLVNKGLSEDEKRVEAKARLDAKPHVSYNVVDENGNPVAEAPAAAAPARDRVNLGRDARVESPEDAALVKTLLDTEIPRNRYDVVRNDDGTKFVVISNNNLGAESFIRVEKTANGWKAVDPRQIDPNAKTIYEGRDRRVAEMHAMNRITGADGGDNPIQDPDRRPDAPAVAPKGQAKAQLPPTEPPTAVAVQKLAKDIDLGDRLIDTMGIESDPEKRHIAGVIEGITYDDANGTATFLINPGRTPDPNGRRVSITRTLMTPMGVDPQTSPNGGNNLSVDGNAAYERYMNRINPPQAPRTPTTPSDDTVTPEPSEARLEPSSRLAALPLGMSMNSSENMTLFTMGNGDFHPIQVVTTDAGATWQVIRSPLAFDNRQPEVLSSHSTRKDAEREAIARINQEEIPDDFWPNVETLGGQRVIITDNPDGSAEASNYETGEILAYIKPGKLEDGQDWWFATNASGTKLAGGQNKDTVIARLKQVIDGKRPPIENPAGILRFDGGLFPTREGSIDRSKLTQEQVATLNNLIEYKAKAESQLKKTAVKKGTEDYEIQYALVQRIAESINELADKAASGDAGDAFFYQGSQEGRLENMRIIPSTVKTKISSDPRLAPNTPVITEASAIIISKTGKPYLLKYSETGRNGDYGGAFVYRIVDGKVEDTRCGSCSANKMSTLDGQGYNAEPHLPRDPHPGMIKVHDGNEYNMVNGPSLQNEGLGGYLVMINRWVAQSHGRRFTHSDTLYAKGNVYSKHVSLNLEDHHREQRDKALFIQHLNTGKGAVRNIPIIAALFACKDVLRYNASFWLNEREMVDGNKGSGYNQSTLWPITQSIINIGDYYRNRFKDNQNAQPGVDYPAIFERHVKSENPDWTDHDLQMLLLNTAYEGGMSREETVAKLDDFIALGPDGPWTQKLSPSEITKIKALRDNIATADWSAYTPLPKPKGLETEKVKFWDSPFGKEKDFTNFVVPKGMNPVRVGVGYAHRPRTFAPKGSPQDWTENPSELASKFSTNELVDSLRTAILAKTNDVTLKFGGNQEGKVNSAAVYRALADQGQDAPKILAGIYDLGLGDGRTDNQDALTKYREGLRDISDDFAEILSQYNIQRPAPFSDIKGKFDTTGNQLLADRVQRFAGAENAATGIRIQPLAISNEKRTLTNGNTISVSAFVATTSPEDWIVNGFTDDPKIIAYNFGTEALTNALSNAIVTGQNYVNLKFSNNSAKSVKIEAIRDALQHQGVDTEAIFETHREFLRAEPQILGRVAGGRYGDVDENGDAVFDLIVNNNQNKLVTAKFKGNVLVPAEDGFEYTLTTNFNGQQSELAKIVKNADGKYEIWYKTPFGEQPTLVVDNGDIAIANVVAALKNEKTFSEPLRHLSTRIGLQDASSVINGMNQKVTSRGSETNIPGRPELYNRFRYEIGVVGADQLLEQNKKVVFAEYTRGADGERSDALFVYNPGGGLPAVNLSEVKNSNGLWVVTDSSRRDEVVGTYSNKADAYKHAEAVASNSMTLSTLMSDDNVNVNSVLEAVKIRPADDLGVLSVGDSSRSVDPEGGIRIRHAGRFAGKSGREFSIVGYTNNKAMGRFRVADSFEYLTLNFYNAESPNELQGPIKASVVRTGNSEWTAMLSYKGQGAVTKKVYRNDPRRAVDELQKLLKEKGLINDSVTFDQLVPKRTVDAIPNEEANYQPAEPTFVPPPLPPTAEIDAARAAVARQNEDISVQPIDLDRARKVVDRILGNQIDLDGIPANAAQPLGGGITAPDYITLPSGLKIKVKRTDRNAATWKSGTVSSEEERMHDNEAVVQGLLDLMGVSATPGGFGLVNGKRIIIDPIAPNVDSTRRWGTVVGAEQNLPENAKAMEDFRHFLVMNIFFGAEDWINNPTNFLVLKNPDGTRRLAVCDGGRALMRGAYLPGDFNNNKWNSTIRSAIFEDMNDFMNPRNLNSPLRVGNFPGTMTREQFIEIVRDRILPLTPEIIAKMSELYSNDEDKQNFVSGLTRRRRELLEYLGIDDVQNNQVPLNAPAAPAAPSVPAAPSAPTARSVRPRAPRLPAPLGTDRTDHRRPITPAEALRVENLRIQIISTSRGVQYDFFKGDDGKLVRTKDINGKTYYGNIKVRADGSVAAVFNQNELGQERNGNAELAIFRGQDAVADAEVWLSTRLHMSTQPVQNYFAARDDNKTDLPLVGRMTQQPQIISRGFLNPTTDRQTSFAKRLVEGKKMSDADRNKYRGILNMNGLTVGEVGSIIDAIKDNEDRTASEIAESVARNHQVPDGEVVNTPSALANPSKTTGGAKRVADLVMGDKIDAGRVAFTHDRGNGLVDVGVIGDNGKLEISRGLDGNLMVALRPDGTSTNNQMVGGNNAVNNFAGRANETVEDVKRAYPNHEVLPNGDLIIAKREFTDANGRKTRYEAVLHRTADETFIGYVRQITLAPNGNVVRTRAAAFTAPAHSSVPVLNRIPNLLRGDGGPGSGMNGEHPNNWFNNLDSVSENIDPRTGQLLPVNLIPGQDFDPIGNTGIQKTGDGLKDALIAHVANLIDRGLLSDQILEQVAGAGDRNFNILSRHQFMDIIERIEARRANPGLNAIPYVSRDKKTIVREGDVVHHYDARGNRLTLKGGAEKIGKVVRRETLQVYEKAQGRYEYRDILWVKFEGRAQVTPIAARRLAVIKRADGSDPVPAVNEPNAPAAPAPNAGLPPAIPRPGARRIPNFNMLGMGNRENVAIELRRVLSSELDVVPSDDPNDPRVRVYSGPINQNNAFVGTIRQLEDGKYKAYYNDGNMNVTEQDFANLVDAIDFMRNGIGQRFPNRANNVPGAPNPNNPDNLPVRVLGGRNVIQRENADGTVEFTDIDNGEILAKVRMTTVDSPGGGVDIWISETPDGLQITNRVNKSDVLTRTSAVLNGDAGPAYLIPRVIAGQDGKDYNVVQGLNSTIYEPNRGDRNEISVSLRPDGKWHAMTGGRDGRPLQTIQSFDFRRDAESHAEKLIMEGGQAPAAPAPATPNNDPLANAFTSAQSFGQGEIDAINNIATLPFGMEAILSGGDGSMAIRPQAGGARIAGIEPVGNGTYNVLTSNDNDSGVNITNHPSKLDAVNAMLNRINGGNQAPQAPATPATPEMSSRTRLMGILNNQSRLFGPEHLEAMNSGTLGSYGLPSGYRASMTTEPDPNNFAPGNKTIDVSNQDGSWTAKITMENDGRILLEFDGINVGDERSQLVYMTKTDAMKRLSRAADDHSQANNVPATPAPAPMQPRNIEISGKGFQGRVSGNRLTFYDEYGNEAATIESQPDGTFLVYEPFGGNRSASSAMDDAVIIAGRKIQANIAMGLHDEPIGGTPDNLPATPAPTPAPPVPATPEAPAEPRRLNIQQVIRMKEIAQRELARLEEQYPDGRGEPEIMDIDPLDGQMKPIRRSEVLRRKIDQYIQRQAEAAQNLREGRDIDAPRNDQSGNQQAQAAPPPPPPPSNDGAAGGPPPSSGPSEPNLAPPSPLPDFPSAEPTPAPPSEDTSLNALNVTLRGVKMTAQRDDTGFTTFDENGGEGAYAVANGDGTFSVYDPSTGENEVVDNEAEAVILAGAINFNNIRGGFHQPKESSEPSAPSQPALPTGYTSSPIASGNNAYEVKHDTDKENTPYYLVEQDGGGFFMSKWDSQNSAEAQRFRRPVQRMAFGSKEQADQWIADDLGPSDGGDGGNGGGGNPPSAPPTTPPAGGNFATDRIPAGMTLQEMNTFNVVGPSDLVLFPDGYPDTQQNRGKLYGVYVKNPNNSGKYDAFVSGPAAQQQERDWFDTPEQAHDWLVEQLRNRSPAPASSRQAPPVPPSDVDVMDWVVENYGDLSVDDVESVVIGEGYTEVTQHLIDTLELKRAFENGFTEMGALPGPFRPSPPPGVVEDPNAPPGGVNINRRVRLSDGGVGYLKTLGMGQRELFNELATARMFEALGIDDLIATSVVDPLQPGVVSVLTREIPNDGMGYQFRGVAEDLKNVREMALIDFLISNGDRHPGNWVFRGDTAYPIDHGYSHAPGPVPTDLDNFGYDATLDRNDDIGQFGYLIEEWANGSRPNLFTQEEFVAIRDKVMALKDMYEGAGPYFSGYFNNMIAPKLDFLMGIWR